MAELWLFRMQWLIFITLGVFAADAGTGDPYANQPRIVIQNGNLILKSADNGDIQLSTTGQGRVQINGNDMSRLGGTSVSGPSEGLSGTIGSYIGKINEIAEQVNQLEENITSISKKVNRFIGNGQDRITNRAIRRVMSKVQQLGDKVNTLTQLLTQNECDSNPCKNGGTCVDTYNGFICYCPSNWEGATCDADVNECARFAGTSLGCQNGATCINSYGGYSCSCPTNWHGIHCTEQYDDCSTASHQELCGHGTCIDEKRAVPGQPKYRCICDPGWQKSSVGPACTEDIDECTGPNRRCSQNPLVACINLPGSFHCGHCPAGYTGNGHSCTDINECEFQNGGCSVHPYVQCSNTVGSRRCGPCPSGYVGNGVQCTFTGVCSINRGGCHPMATCIENSAITGTYRECRCPTGYVGNGEGLNGCVEAAGMTCANNLCQHGTCQIVGQSFHCICSPGYYGTLCDREEIDVCFSQPCQNGGTCVRQTGTFSCVCPEGYEGPTCASRSGGCGEHLLGSNGTIKFPQSGASYGNVVNCAWVIEADESKVVNVTFDTFQISYSRDCEDNFIQLNDGPTAGSRVIGRFCGMDLHGESFVSTHSQLYLWLHANAVSGSDGFSLAWIASDPVCGGVLNVSEYGAINSPGYPGKYPMSRNCSWLVRVPIGKRIQFHFATLKMEEHPTCDYDSLKIYDGASDRDPIIGTYCTTVTPPPLTTSGHTSLVYFHTDNTISDTGFHITYSSQSTIQGCGGVLTAPTGSVKSPNYPEVYENNLNCEWLIRIHPDSRLLLTFKEFNLESHDNCAFDVLEIFGGEDDNAPLLGRYCGTTVPDDLFTINYQLFIRFRSDNSLVHSGFKIDYKAICGGVFTELTGIISSPYYPENYPSRAQCIYDIRLEPGYLINVTFHNMEIEEHTECHFDYLQIRDGDSESSPLLGQLCGYTIPENIVSTYNFLWMKFETDGSQQNKGFYAQYEAIPMGCGGVLTNLQGQFSSPREDDRYPHSVECSWLLRAPAGYVVRLTFTSFMLEPHQDCRFDYVTVEESTGAVFGRFCGSQTPPILTSMSNSLLVKFVADSTVAREGFTATYEFINAMETCGGTFYQESGVIRSPGFPEMYPHNAHCVWILRGRNHRQISLNVTSFNLEEHTNCQFDYLEIRNGGYETSPLVGKHCGGTFLSSVKSHSNVLRLEFKTDGTMSAPGFEIYFDSTATGCGGILTSPRGTVVSPNYPQPYPYNADCEWKIQVSSGSLISLAIIEVDIEEHRDCRFDYVQVFDGSTESSKSLLRICNNQQNPGAVMSTGNTLLVRFRSDFSQEAGGFHLVYQTVCNNKLTQRRGVIESPNFPNTYPHNHNCSWTIEAPPGSNISLSFSHLFLEGTGNTCQADYVEVVEVGMTDEQTQLGKYCGDQNQTLGTIETKTNRALIRLVTDHSVTREGFRLEWSMKGCGGDIYDKPSGNITSPNYPNGYPKETTCFWHVWYPPGSRVELTINELDLEGPISNCQFDYVRVYAGEDDESPLLLNTCAEISQPQVVTSHGNHMVVKFASDNIFSRRGFSATYRKMPGGCGGTLQVLEGNFISPNYPNPYNVNDDCYWLIQVKKSHRVELDFYDFNLPEGDNCTNGYLAVYDGNSSFSDQLLKHCGGKPEGHIFSTGNQMLVRLAADGNNVGTGFRAHYVTGCGSRLMAGEGGEITSPIYPDKSVNNCSWIIQASDPGEKVVLIVTNLQLDNYKNCTYSNLVVQDGDLPDSPVLSKFCGTTSPPPIVSMGSILHVSLTGWGLFRATYGLASIHCGGSYDSWQGTFGSPGYPTNYDRDTECVWTVQASEGNRVHLTFEAFNLEESENCNKDYVEIHENDATGRLIGRYCGNSIPSNVTAARKLWIKFKSDDIETQAGFLAHYELQHGTVLNGTEGVIASPGYPQGHLMGADFAWIVFVPAEQFVSVQFLEIAIADMHDNSQESCIHTRIQIFDGLDDTAPPLGEFCSYQLPDPVISTGNVVFIKYKAQDYWAGKFRIRWHAVTADGVTSETPDPTAGEVCWEEVAINASDSFNVKSPNYPQNYPDDINCTYIIRVPHHQHVQINITDLEMENSYPTCNYDRLEVYYMKNPNVNEWMLNTSLCGRQNNTLLQSPTNLMKLIFITDKHVNFKGFHSFATSKCGTRFTDAKGVLRSNHILPELSHVDTFTALNCEFFISVRPKRTIQLRFDQFNVPSNSICSTNYIKIRNGATSSSPPLGDGTFCGNHNPPVMETSSNEVYIQIVVASLSTGAPDFVLRYEELSIGCGGRLFVNEDSRYVEITSPNYPNPPIHDTECEWVIVSPSTTRMRVDFDSEFHMSPDCYSGDNLEFLDIHDGGTEMAPALHRFCGHDQPSSVMSTGNALFIRYVTSVDQPQAGFKAKIGIANCGGTIAGFMAKLHSTNYPDPYGNSEECEWFLKMPMGYHIVLNLTDFSTPNPPSGANCTETDYLEVRNSDAEGEVVDIICGTTENASRLIAVPGSQAYVKFKSNSRDTGKGFEMLMSGAFEDGCGGYAEGPSGVITSPNYPNALTAARECIWRIRAPPGRRVKITFQEFNLPKDDIANLCLSSIQIAKYPSWRRRNATQPDPICGSSLPASVSSSSGYMGLRFFTHGLSPGQGFSLTYSTEEEAICGGDLPLPTGEISSPNATELIGEAVLECHWTIGKDMPDNQTVVFRFDVLDVPGVMANYCRDGMLFAFGDRRSFARFCGNYTSEVLLTTPVPGTNIILTANLDKPMRGIHGIYYVSNCGGVLRGENIELTSPGYPNNYPPSTVCHWIITVPEGETMILTVTDLRLEENCEKDYVLVRNGPRQSSPRAGKFCGTHSPAPIISTGNTMSVLFISDPYGTAPGFKITTVEMQRGCGGLIHMHQGNLSSPNRPSHYDNNVECSWIIEYEPGYVAKLEFVGRFDLEMDSSCSKDFLLIEEMNDDNAWYEAQRSCGPVTPQTYMSKNRKIKITFRTNNAITGDGFDIRYSATCGGNFTGSNGVILSPGYPDHYEHNLDCVYTIGKPNHYVTLSFDDYFSLEGGNDCGYDFITIQYNNTNSTTQGPYCGTEVPAPRTLRGPVTVRFRTDESYAGHGFTLLYDILECGAILTEPTGRISTPNVASHDLEAMDCIWQIQAPPDRVIALRFRSLNISISYRCWQDYLEIRDGLETGPLIGKVCGNSTPTVKSTGNLLTLKVHLGTGNADGRGFAAAYKTTYGINQGCGGTKMADSGDFESFDVDSDGSYEPSLDCRWLVVGDDADMVFQITFDRFDIEQSSNTTCIYDYVELREDIDPDSALIGRYCGSTAPTRIVTSRNRFSVRFHSDSQVNRAGFKLSFQSIASPCGHSMLESKTEPQNLTTPNYPGAYPVNLRCKWTIWRNATSRGEWSREKIQLTINYMNIPCDGDYLEIQKMRPSASYTRRFHAAQVMGGQPIRLCGEIRTHDIFAPSGVNIVFHSDSKANLAHGFSISYKNASCNRTYTTASGVISNPAYPGRYNSDDRCNMTIVAPPGKTISLYFSRMEVQDGRGKCELTNLKVYDGLKSTAHAVESFCGLEAPNPMFSTGRYLYLEAQMQYNLGLYYMIYTTTDQGRGCGGSIYAEEGVISSPLYPQTYNRAGECVWYLSVPGYHSVNVEFKTFVLNSTVGCDSNYVELYDGHSADLAKRVGRYCGSDLPGVHNSRTNEVTIKLKTDTRNLGPGFLLNFQTNSFLSDTTLPLIQRHAEAETGDPFDTSIIYLR